MTQDRYLPPLVAVLLATIAAVSPTKAQLAPLQGVTGIQIEYRTPTNDAHRAIYDRLMRRQVLEQYKAFMAPLKFGRSLHVALQSCNGIINAVHMGGRISYCYELIAATERQIAEAELLPGFRREDALVAGFVSTLLHETGHAVFQLFDIPIWGREEDAADAIAAYVALQLGNNTARRILSGTAFVWRASEIFWQKNRSRRFEDYSDEHGTDAQRFFNALCIAYGSDLVERRSIFSDFVPLLSEARRGQCPREYLHVKNSFARFILPHVDGNLMNQVRRTEWLRSEDGSDILPPAPPGGGPRGTGPNGPAPGGPGAGGPGTGGPGPGAPVFVPTSPGLPKAKP